MMLRKKSLLLSVLLSMALVNSMKANVHPSPIKITKTGPAFAELGEIIKYEIKVTNEGKRPISRIELQDFVTPCACESPFVDAKDDCHFGLKFNKTVDGFTAKTHHKLAPGKSFQITALIRACKPAGSVLTNTVRFTGEQDDDCVVACTSAETKLGKCPGALRVRISPESVLACPGGTFKLTSHVENNCGKVQYTWFAVSHDGMPKDEELSLEGDLRLEDDKPVSSKVTWTTVGDRAHHGISK